MATISNFGAAWNRASLFQRVMLVALLLGCLGAAGLLIRWATQPKLSLLYSNLSPQEAAKIVNKLRDAKIPYELKDGGTTVYAPEDRTYTLWLSMAEQGLPADDQGGYRILDTEKFGASPFTQHINYNRALEGELAKTIGLIDGVTGARVHIVRPESTLFASKEKGASASVILKLRGARRLNGSQVGAIVHLVAGSVEGLSPDKVVVADSQGNLLSGEANANDLAKGASTILDYKTRVEQYLSAKAEDMLASALGPNKASVRVDVVLETKTVSNTNETKEPTKSPMKESTKTSVKKTAGKSEGGTAGGESGEDTETEYGYTRKVQEELNPPGKILSKSVAAMVDLSGPPGADGKPTAAAVTLADVEDIIRKAIGIGENDQIKVVNAPFYKAPEVDDKAAEKGIFTKDFMLEMAKRFSLGVLVIGALLAMKIFGGAKKGEQAQVVSSEVGGAGGGLLAAAEAGGDPQMLRARITKALQENPEEVKKLFLTWVKGEEGEA